MSERIHLGFEVGSGEPVEIPLKHLAVTGQTQESGKTTTLEALVSRADVSALAFVTKRGEQSFADGRRIQPYFRDRADWQFVTSIIDATLQEKNKFLRPWIMKICRTTRTLGEVQSEVRKALRTAKGLNEGVYTQLDAYLDLIVPEIRRAPLAPALELHAGLNVMDLGGSPTPMQMLLVQSALDWVNEKATDTIVVVPEAWEFIPEGKGSPVKASAIDLVRKGGGIGNRIWVDSQDMAGVDKTILRGCAVWLIGVQREANEIKRNLSNIPANVKKPSAAQVALLERGQFYACFGSHAIKTYVQPAWMSEEEAQAIAWGERKMTSKPPAKRAPTPIIEEPTVNEAEAQRLRDENTILRQRLEALEAESSNAKVVEDVPRSGRRQGGDAGSTPVSANASDEEGLYQRFKARLLKEPAVLRVLVEKPELNIAVERQIIDVAGDTIQGRTAQLIAEGFFDQPQKADRIREELARRGFSVARPSMYATADKFALLGFLTKEESGYKAVEGMKINIIDA